MQGCSHQHIWGAAHQEQEAAAAAAMAAITRSSSGDDDLFWAGNAGQLAAAELFSIPPAYQPRVKDLTAPGGPCLLSMDSDMSDISTPLAAPMAVPAEQHTVSRPAPRVGPPFTVCAGAWPAPDCVAVVALYCTG